MPKFYVHIGQLVRQQKTVIVEAGSAEDVDPDEVWELYDGDYEDDWTWGVEKSEANQVLGPAPDDAPVDVVLDGGDDDKRDERELGDPVG